MSISLPPVDLPKKLWVDLYAATGLSVGTKLIIQNIGRDEVILTESDVKPISGYGLNKLPTRDYLTNAQGNVGAWAYSSGGSRLQGEADA